MATPDDDQVAAILAAMRDSQTPAISPIKSPTKRAISDSEEEIPASQPPPSVHGPQRVSAHYGTK